MACATKPSKPLLLYDGGCGFCRCTVQQWRKRGEGILDVASSQSVAGEPYGFSKEKPLGAVQLIECSGNVRSGAEAALRFMALCGSKPGRLGWFLLKRVPAMRAVMELGYSIVAGNRRFLSWLFRCSAHIE